MSKENIYQNGPHLLAAFFCERVLEEKDGTRSAIRIIDRLAIQASGSPDDVASTMLRLPKHYPVDFWLRLKQGEEGAGNHTITIRLVTPDGKEKQLMNQNFTLEGPASAGVDMVAKLPLPASEPGTCWLDVYLDEIRVTRVPFTVSLFTRTVGPGVPETEN